MTTTQLKGPEAVERAGAATLSAYLNSELDAVWSVWATNDAADGITVPKLYPAHIVTGHLGVASDFPTLYVTTDTGRQLTNFAPNAAELDHHLMVSVWLASDSLKILNKTMQRYLLAIWEVFMKHQSLDGSIQVTGIDPMEYGRTPATKMVDLTAGLLRVGGWTFTVHVEQGTSVG